MIERDSGGPLINLETNIKAVERQKADKKEDYLRRSYNATLAPNPVRVGTMQIETTFAFTESYVFYYISIITPLVIYYNYIII